MRGRYQNGGILRDDELKLIGPLIAISAGAGLQQLPVPVEVGEKLMACYEGT